ncbi:MAG TPA: isocitrate lyase/PEP mutase family protein [Phycisphaerae bacterium]|jgi:methylisocitrate lyase|nr:isocitrate lyase/PEP mutase family protein [Phycisphaerae bacterium]HOB74055.1 isocitrate lyase/PEP mutase family protein [Phycisphaerae bacterium]HOJ53814.1 isocitrate lyase/PEP mutase family protein [Phycisphaerae bacterium]HOL26145.1 isocitrate lyase/PEP mutase family protein [Phycisphaerae bacterium]HPP20132.1 isocitrate lyase/PEP mutase family protein [Phycisphaerae bacterium]
MKATTQLKQMLSERKALVMPGCHDALSAKLAQRAGFRAIQASGFGIAASLLGEPDVGLATLTEMVDQTRRMVNAVTIPVMADGDTGNGNAINVIRTVKEYENAGCAGINLEDQVFPKRCGHMEGKELVSCEEMVLKIRAAVHARRDPDFIINARTDAIAVEGIDAAIKRANAYAEAGADLIFMEAPTSIEMIQRCVDQVNAPLSINLFDAIKGGKTPLVAIEELRKMGVARVSIPVGLIFACAKGMMNYLNAIAGDQLARDRYDLAVTFDEFKQIVGLGHIRELEKQFLPSATYKSKYEA